MYDMTATINVVHKLNRMHSKVLEVVDYQGIFERYSSGRTLFDVALLDPPSLGGISLETLFSVSIEK